MYGYVVVQFYTLFKFYFPLLLGMVMSDNEFKTKGNKIQTKDKIEPHQLHYITIIICYKILHVVQNKPKSVIYKYQFL